MDKTGQLGFWRLRYTILTLVIFGWIFSFLDRMVMSMALPFVGKEFSLDATGQGAILSVRTAAVPDLKK
jgi:sugar phosphate permease